MVALFAVGCVACFESALGAVGRRERAEVRGRVIDSRSTNALRMRTGGFMPAIELQVTLPRVTDSETAARDATSA